MSFFKQVEQRDDMYSLEREGCSVDADLPRIGLPDRPHMFQDGGGEIFPASKLKAAGDHGIRGVIGKLLKLGPPHSHEEIDGDRAHILEDMQEIPRDLINRTRRGIFNFRKKRRENIE